MYTDPVTRIFGLFCGHGPNGGFVSNICYKILLKRILEHSLYFSYPMEVLKDAFKLIPGLLHEYFEKNMVPLFLFYFIFRMNEGEGEERERK